MTEVSQQEEQQQLPVVENTSTTITPIDPSSVHRICSGQVIVDLATAVKELIENSLDAGATAIDIRLKEYGSEVIEVSDNGGGVSPGDRKLLMKKYHTSKLSTFDDLEQLMTFGFRGEALSSLCAVARVSAVTKVDGEECGVKLEFDSHGELVQETMIARAVGTTIAVKDLFHSLPVRHKEFKKNLKRDFSKLVSLLQAYSLIHTETRFLCTNQLGNGSARHTVISTQSIVPSTSGSGNGALDLDAVKAAARSLFNRRNADTLAPLRRTNDRLGVTIEGLVSSCNSGQATKSDSRFFFVNKRPIQYPKAGSVVYETFKSFVSPAQTAKPMCIINFQVDPKSVDVNVTPDKRKVFFHNETEICRFLQQCLVDLWEGQRSTFHVKQVFENKGAVYVDQRIDRMFDPVIACRDKTGKKDDGSSPEKGVVAVVEHAPTSKADVIVETRKERKRSLPISQFALGSTPVQGPEALLVHPSASTPGDNTDTPGYTGENKKAKTRVRHVEVIDQTKSLATASDINQEDGKSPAASEQQEEDNEQEVMPPPVAQDHAVIPGPTNDSEIEMIQCIEVEKSIEQSEQRQPSADEISLHTESSLEGQPPTQEVTEKPMHEPRDADPNADSILCVDIDLIRERTLRRAREIVEREHQELSKSSKAMRFNTATMMNSTDEAIQGLETFEKEKQAEDELIRIFNKENFKNLKVIGQFNLGFIVAKLGDDLFIVDQHASGMNAESRVLG